MISAALEHMISFRPDLSIIFIFGVDRGVVLIFHNYVEKIIASTPFIIFYNKNGMVDCRGDGGT